MRPRTDVVITAHGDHYLVADPYGARPTITLSALQLELYWGLARGRSAASLQRAARARLDLA